MITDSALYMYVYIYMHSQCTIQQRPLQRHVLGLCTAAVGDSRPNTRLKARVISNAVFTHLQDI